MRVGLGYDIHRFASSGGPLKLGGVAIAYSRGLQGHSDADVVLHAVTDALLGAIGGPDLGELFPPSDPQWRGAASAVFVEHARKLAARGGWRIQSVDVVVIADEPKVADYKSQLRASVGKLLGVDADVVSIKGKTTEGFPPGADGIAAHAVVLVSQDGPGPKRR
jgi:2-C-methyl-D-erythritol 4-phosphate cytidylyltransferase/2-C-methyl-D-erythritol 2,4-cyclodiphosphate synthase